MRACAFTIFQNFKMAAASRCRKNLTTASKMCNVPQGIEIKEIDTVSKKLKVHYIGYADKYDEWKDFDESSEFPVVKLEKVEPADNQTVDERAALFSRRLYLEFKHRLQSTRKDDPEVRLKLPMVFDIFRHTFDRLGELAADSGKHSKLVKTNDDLVPVLGSRWYIRVKNVQGDSEAVVDSSVWFWLLARPPLNAFIFIGGKLFS